MLRPLQLRHRSSEYLFGDNAIACNSFSYFPMASAHLDIALHNLQAGRLEHALESLTFSLARPLH
jgi:hypothetical protein